MNWILFGNPVAYLSLHGAQVLSGVAHVALRDLLHLLEDADGARHLEDECLI